MAATKSLKKCELDAKWYLIDATDCTLGRLAFGGIYRKHSAW